jgi:hypothetical protein
VDGRPESSGRIIPFGSSASNRGSQPPTLCKANILASPFTLSMKILLLFTTKKK